MQVARTTAQVLRPYQDECIAKIQTSWAAGEVPLAWLATGGGKTTIFSELLVRTITPGFQRALVFAHTQEIIYQIADRITNQFGAQLNGFYGPNFDPGIGVVMGAKDSPDARIVVATRQSLHPKRLERVLLRGPFDLVVIDEGHHIAPDNTYHNILKALREANPNMKTVGLTATPKRTDKKGLGVVFTTICFRWTILDGIKGGYLAPATRLRIKTGVDTTKVRTSQGDYDQKQLISVLDAANWVKLAVEAFQDYAGQRQTLAFFPKVDMSREFVRQLNEAGIPAAHVDANTPKDERTDLLRRYQRGELRVVSNMGVLTEGFDAPQTSAILMARPTRSETLFTQIIGRGLRLYPGKTDCLVIDLTVVDTKVLEIGTILGQMADCPKCHAQFWKGLKNCPKCGEDVDERAVNTKTCPACGEEVPRSSRVCPECGHFFTVVLTPPDFKGTGKGLQAEVVQLFHDLSAAWQPDEAGWFSCSVGYAGSLVIAPPSYASNDMRLRERIGTGYSLLSELDAETKEELLAQIDMLQRELNRIDQYTLYYVPPIEKDPITRRDLLEEQQPPVGFLRGNGDLASLMKEADVDAMFYGGHGADKDANWRGELASEGQRWKLRHMGVKKLDKDLTKGQAAQMISHLQSIRRVKRYIAEDALPEVEEA